MKVALWKTICGKSCWEIYQLEIYECESTFLILRLSQREPSEILNSEHAYSFQFDFTNKFDDFSRSDIAQLHYKFHRMNFIPTGNQLKNTISVFQLLKQPLFAFCFYGFYFRCSSGISLRFGPRSLNGWNYWVKITAELWLWFRDRKKYSYFYRRKCRNVENRKAK